MDTNGENDHSLEGWVEYLWSEGLNELGLG